jgi:hypothetical protein
MMELVSQADKEGVSLGVLISREMSKEEMESAQIDLASAMSENYASIKHFMADINLPSISEVLSRNDGPLRFAEDLPSDELATEE